MLRQIVKIANKLDSLGLTKEADVLDRYINKMAQESGGTSKDTDYDRIKQNERLKDIEQRAQTHQYEQQEMRLAEDIYKDVMVNTPEHLKTSAATFKDSFMRAWLRISDKPRAPFYGSNQGAWENTGKEMANKMWEKYGQSYVGPAEDPWAKSYGSRARELKSVWTKRTTATKKNPSFDNFQAWLKSRRLERGGVDAIIQKLMNETYTAIASIGAGPQYDPSAPIPMPGETQSSAAGQASRPSGSRITEDRAEPAYKPGSPDRTDYKVEIESAMKEDT
jgi:hypothetical protein